MSSVSALETILFGAAADPSKRAALQRLDAAFRAKTGKALRAENVNLVASARTDKPFELSLFMGGKRVVDLYAQDINIVVYTKKSIPRVHISFPQPIVINMDNPLQLVALVRAWFKAFQTRTGHLSEVNKDFTVECQKVDSFPNPQLLQSMVKSVRIEVGGPGQLVVSLELFVVGYDMPGPLQTAATGLLDAVFKMGQFGQVRLVGSEGRKKHYVISKTIDIASRLPEHPCVKYFMGASDSHDACAQAINNMFLILSRSGLDPVIIKALGGADLGVGAQSRLQLIAHVDNDVVDKQIIPLRDLRVTPRDVDRFVQRISEAKIGDDVLSTIEAVATAWKAYSPSLRS